MTDRELLELVEEGMAIHSPNSPEYIVCAALRERLAHKALEKLAEIDQDLGSFKKPEQDLTKYSEEHCPRCGSGDYVVQHTLYTGIETTYKSCEDCGNHWGHE